MSLSVSELRVIGRSLQRDEVTGQEDRKVFFAAVGLRWAGVIMFLAMLALTIATTILLYSLREAGPLRWKIMGGLIMATVALGYSLFAIRVGAPEGVRLDRKAARQLWKIVDEICRSANAAVPTAIILTDENNAAAATVPRGGLSPHSDMYLVLGLPLLIALAPDQARAVIAHEIGHFSKQHGRTSLEVYKALTMSARIIAYAHGSGNPLMRLLARFYAFAGGRLNRAILRLSRAQEFQADHIAGKVVGNVKAAEALVVLNLADNIIGASDRLLAEERKLIEAGRPAAELEAALALVLARPDPEYSTHPGLAARVAALGQTMYVPAPVGAAHAAEAWLPNLEIYIRDFDEERAKHLGTREKAREEYRAEAATRLQAEPAPTPTAAKVAAQTPMHSNCSLVQAGRLFDRARDALTIKDLALASALNQQAMALNPASPWALLNTGIMRIERGEPDCLEPVVAAIERDPRLANWAFPAAREYLRQHPTTEGVITYQTRLDAVSAKYGTWRFERDCEPGLREKFLAAELSADAENAIGEALAGVRGVITATLVRRVTSEWNDIPAFVLAVRMSGGWAGSTPKDEEEARASLNRAYEVVGVYGSVQVIFPEAWNEHLVAWRIKRVKGAFHFARD